jgi:hypothetical protein
MNRDAPLGNACAEKPGWLLLGRERSALRDPLNRPRRDAELRSDLMKSRPSRSRQSLTDSPFCLGRHSVARTMT